MNEVDNLVAALFSAVLSAKEPTRDSLIEHYEYFLRALPERRDAVRRAESERGMDTWRK